MSTRFPLGPADFRDNEMRGFAVGKRNVIVARIHGQYVALDDWCNHAGCLLSGGYLEEKLVICPCHEVGFDMETGKNVTSPGVCDDQPVVKIVEKDGQLILIDFNPNP
ncbi:MAG: Rieske (2Fe-2S) protein [Myxococcota bacterium]|nr:Rieske (2Fe-2S) protein [Myxococcota bacterium]